MIEGLQLPDKDDRHVLAVAIRCSASVIVTFNQKDFPADVLKAFGIEAQHPDVFIGDLLDLDAASVVAAAQRQRATLKKPPLEAEPYLEILLKQGLVHSTKVLSGYKTLLRGCRPPDRLPAAVLCQALASMKAYRPAIDNRKPSLQFPRTLRTKIAN